MLQFFVQCKVSFISNTFETDTFGVFSIFSYFIVWTIYIKILMSRQIMATQRPKVAASTQISLWNYWRLKVHIKYGWWWRYQKLQNQSNFGYFEIGNLCLPANLFRGFAGISNFSVSECCLFKWLNYKLKTELMPTVVLC